MRRSVIAALVAISFLGSTWGASSGAMAAPLVAPSVRITHGSTAPSEYWWQQGPSDCVPMSARVVVAAVTGRVVGYAQIDATAARVAGYDADGTEWALVPALLAAYGVTAQIFDSASLDDLRAALDTTGPVMARINSGTVWATFPALIAESGTDPDHVLVVEQINDATHTVTLVDSGYLRTETVPIPVFLEAWAASGNSAVIVGASQ